jgi:nitroreductase
MQIEHVGRGGRGIRGIRACTASPVQNVCLAAHDEGLGACRSTTLVRCPGLLRSLLPGSAEKTVAAWAT